MVMEEEGGRKEKTLLRKLNIPVEHIDYAFVGKCEDGKELERILRVLRSGEEGTYPDLEAFVTARLEKINPKSRFLRVEVPILRPSSLEATQRNEIETDLSVRHRRPLRAHQTSISSELS
jgi:hypothetical protein